MATATKRTFQVVLEWDERDRAWVTYVPALDFLSTYGDSRDEALENTKEAIAGYLEAAAKEGLPVPEADARTIVGLFTSHYLISTLQAPIWPRDLAPAAR